MSKFARFLRDENGSTAVEYSLMVSLISVAIIWVVTGLGSKLNLTFRAITNVLP